MKYYLHERNIPQGIEFSKFWTEVIDTENKIRRDWHFKYDRNFKSDAVNWEEYVDEDPPEEPPKPKDRKVFRLVKPKYGHKEIIDTYLAGLSVDSKPPKENQDDKKAMEEEFVPPINYRPWYGPGKDGDKNVALPVTCIDRSQVSKNMPDSKTKDASDYDTKDSTFYTTQEGQFRLLAGKKKKQESMRHDKVTKYIFYDTLEYCDRVYPKYPVGVEKYAPRIRIRV